MKKVWKWIGLIALIIVIIGLTVSLKVYHDVKASVDAIYTPISESEKEQVGDKRVDVVDASAEKQPFSALILGVDKREGDSGRSDTMIVLTVNPTLGTMKMLSIPRDTYTDIVGKNKKDKINHAYAFGGMEMSVKTVEGLLGIPIDYAATINMEGFKEIVDFVGGISVDNEFAFSVAGDNFNEGVISLNGEQALKYVRMRYNDPSGDFGRQNRQKQVVQEVLNKGVSLSSLFNYQSVLDILKNNVSMNITFDEIQNIQRNYSTSFGNIEQLYFRNGQEMRIGGIYFYVPEEGELKEIQRILKEHLEL